MQTFWLTFLAIILIVKVTFAWKQKDKERDLKVTIKTMEELLMLINSKRGEDALGIIGNGNG